MMTKHFICMYSGVRNKLMGYVYQFQDFFPTVRFLFQTIILSNLGLAVRDHGCSIVFSLKSTILCKVFPSIHKFISRFSHQYFYFRPYVYCFFQVFPPVRFFQTCSRTFLVVKIGWILKTFWFLTRSSHLILNKNEGEFVPRSREQWLSCLILC